MPSRFSAELSSPDQSAASTSAEPTPRIMFDPARLATTRSPHALAMLLMKRAVVVFPFVPVTSTQPWPSSAASSATRWGSIRSATSPGRAVPPPSRKRRESVAAALAAAMAAVRRITDVLYLFPSPFFFLRLPSPPSYFVFPYFDSPRRASDNHHARNGTSTMSVEYRPLTNDDLEQAVEVESLAFYNRPTPERVEQMRQVFPPPCTLR